LTTLQTCSVKCANGYNGTATDYTCTTTGDLSGSRPSCRPLTCRNDVPAFQGVDSSTCTSVTYGSSCTLSCATGYALASSASPAQWTCNYDAAKGSVKLAGSAPMCEAQPCTANLPSGKTLNHSCTGVKTDQSCAVGCIAGYTGNSTVRTCLSNGLLSGSSPTCSIRSCAVSNPAGAVLSCQSAIYGERCQARCHPGYKTSSFTSYLCGFLGHGDSLALYGAPPSCTPEPCMYNLPVGDNTENDCSGVGTGGSCVVNCAKGYYDASVTYSCLADATFNGSLPMCLEITSTATTTSVTTTSVTTSTTLTTITQVPTAGIVTTITGGFIMQVNDPQAFVSNPNVTAGVEKGIADLAGVTASWVKATLRVVRRLQSQIPRVLAAGLIDVSYTITVPASATAAGAGSTSDILNILANTNASALTTSVSNGVASTSSGNFLVAVQSIRQVQSSTPGTSTPGGPSTTVEPVSRGGIALEEEEDDRTPVAGIVVAFLLSVCCGCGMIGIGMWHYAKKKDMTVRQLLNSGGDQIQRAESPVQRPQPPEAWGPVLPAQPEGQQQELPRVLSPELQAVRDLEDSQNQALPGEVT